MFTHAACTMSMLMLTTVHVRRHVPSPDLATIVVCGGGRGQNRGVYPGEDVSTPRCFLSSPCLLCLCLQGGRHCGGRRVSWACHFYLRLAVLPTIGACKKADGAVP